MTDQGRKSLLVLLVLLTLLFGIAGLFFLIRPSPQATPSEDAGLVSSHDRNRRALKKGIDFLLATKSRFANGTTMLIRELNMTCKNRRLDSLWRNRFQDDIGYIRFATRFFEGGGPLHASNGPAAASRLFDHKIVLTENEIVEMEKTVHSTDLLLMKAVYCNNFTYDNIMKDIDKIGRDEGYFSAHILISLHLMRMRRCYGEQLLMPLITSLVEELTVAEDSHKGKEALLSLCSSPRQFDLYAERAAFIGLSGFPIKDQWIETILGCQNPDGSWPDSHSTALSLIAIAQKEESCD